MNDWMMSTAHQMAWWSVLGLLSSSCCALQLILNAMSFEWSQHFTWSSETYLCGVDSSGSIQISWDVAWSRPYQRVPTTAATLLSASMALLPELLAWNVQLKTLQRKSMNKSVNQSSSSGTSSLLEFRLENVGCAAYLSTVSGVLSGISQVQDFQLSLDIALATVYLHKKDMPVNQADEDRAAKLILDKLDDAGFPTKEISKSSSIWSLFPVLLRRGRKQ